MKKIFLFTGIFKISYVFYVLVLVALPYITAQVWADALLFLFIGSLIYQLVYIISLRKKDNISLFTSIKMFLLYAICSFSIFIILDYANSFINGYTPSDILGNSTGDTYYGFEAIAKDNMRNIVFVPYLIINAMIIIIINVKKYVRKNSK